MTIEMTVGELKARLSKFNPETKIFTQVNLWGSTVVFGPVLDVKPSKLNDEDIILIVVG